MPPRSFLVLGAAFTLGALGAVGSLAGCLDNACLLKVCDGPECRCSISTCGDGADFDNRTGQCRCLAGHVPIGGRCMDQREADAFCGPGYRFQGGGCFPATCPPGAQLDHATGQCIAAQQVAQVATNMGVSIAPGQTLGCPTGTRLVIDGQAAACVPLEQTCARDETWTGQACAKVAACPPNAAWDAASARCVAYAQGSTEQGLGVDVNQWAATNFGPNGGPGMPAFCGAFAKKPWSFGVNAGVSAAVRVSVMMSFPEGQVAKGVVQTTTVFASTGGPVPPKGAALVDGAAHDVLASLVRQGGRARAATAVTTVTCPVVNAARPLAIPASGGL